MARSRKRVISGANERAGLVAASGKMVLLDKLLPKLRAEKKLVSGARSTMRCPALLFTDRISTASCRQAY